jgi:FkbM family methyltransferase
MVFAALRDTASMTAAFARWPTFSRTSYRMVARLRSAGLAPRTVIDIGANRGQFTVAARNLLHPSRIHSFEPLPAAADSLEKSCAGYPEVVVHRVALGAQQGRAALHVNKHSQSSSLLELGGRHLQAFPAATAVDHVDVIVRRLDAELDAIALERPVLVKVDAQGYESEILAGAGGSVEAMDALIVETSFTPLYEGETPFLELLDQVSEMGFRFERPVGTLTDPTTGEYLQMDALFSRDR